MTYKQHEPDRDLLDLLIDVTERIPPEHFDMRQWWIHNVCRGSGDCRSVGCCIGHLQRSPEMEERWASLKLQHRDDQRHWIISRLSPMPDWVSNALCAGQILTGDSLQHEWCTPAQAAQNLRLWRSQLESGQ